MNDDHGDQFPGALPPAATRRPDADMRLVRMHAAYVAKVNAVVGADQEDLAHELAEDYAAEATTARPAARSAQRPTGRNRRRPQGTGAGSARPGTPARRWTERTRETLRRFDRYTLDVFNPRTPHALRADLPERSS